MTRELDRQMQEVIRELELLKQSKKIPEQRKPKILICGKTGVGKTTAINTLFGEEVGNVGYFTRGTSEDTIYEWEANSENIRIVDLPGLGDSPKNDQIFREIYRRQAKDADGFIIIVSPPRPAEEGTLRTVRLLLSCGIPSKHIVFGYNKLAHLQYPDGKGKLANVEIDGLIGPTSKQHISMVSQAKLAFYNDLIKSFPRNTFHENQIIEFDSISGWNLHSMLFKVVEILPFETLNLVQRAADQASREVKKREREKLRKEREAIEKQKIMLAEIQEQIRQKEEARRKHEEKIRSERLREETQRVEQEKLQRQKEDEKRKNEDLQKREEAVKKQEEELKQKKEDEERQKIQQQLDQVQRELEEQKKRAEERELALKKFEEQEKTMEQKIVDKVFEGLGVVAKVAVEVGKRILGFFFGG